MANKTERFFSEYTKMKRGSDGSEKSNAEVTDDLARSKSGSGAKNDEEQGQCLTLRWIQCLFPCFNAKSVWDASQGDISKSHEVEETKYPLSLRILESKTVDVIFLFSCIASGLLFFFSEGFLLRNHILSGVFHTVNGIYTFGLFGQWIRILIESKYSKTNQGYTKYGVILSLLSIFPSDIIILTIYSINNRGIDTIGDRLVITMSRLNYLIRVYFAHKHLSAWENQLVFGDISMFFIRLVIHVSFFVHAVGCIWHRTACYTFTSKHFKMTPQEAATDACFENSWVILLLHRSSVLSNYQDDGNVILNHYLASIYWVVSTSLRYGDGDIEIYLSSTGEIVFSTLTQIISWLFILTYVTGTLTSLLVERDTERENYLTRRFAIKHFLDFSSTDKHIVHDVRNFYDFLWERRKGISHLTLIDKMPPSMKAEVFYDINKFLINQLPLLEKMEESFLMKLAVQMKHSFHLQGEILFKKHQSGSCLIYVVKGFLEVLNDEETSPITIIKSGSAIGEIYLMHPYPHAATVRCGTQCDIMVLTRQNFREVIELYPQLWETLNQRVMQRINKCDVPLSLAEREYSKYIAAFEKINIKIRPIEDLHTNKESFPELDNFGAKSLEDQHPSKQALPDSTDNSGEILIDQDPPDGLTKNLTTTDDDTSIRPTAYRRSYIPVPLSSDKSKEETKIEKQMSRRSLEEEAYAILESDITGAKKLFKGLDILIPPLTVGIPPQFAKGAQDLQNGGNQFLICLTKILPSLRLKDRSSLHFLWKFWISICILLYIWFFTYMFAFHEPETIFWGYIFHIIDVLVLMDFCLDLFFETVVTPQRTLESTKEILIYKIRTINFFLRIFGFLPWEYLIAIFSKWNWESEDVNPWFYFLKFNRALEIIVIVKFVDEIESTNIVPILTVFIIKFIICVLFSIHGFAVCLEHIYRDWLDRPKGKYLIPFYWSTEVITTIGTGDFIIHTVIETMIILVGLFVGVGIVTYFGAKIGALLSNSARRRINFKHTYYSSLQFMKRRQFTTKLIERVSGYYGMQWIAHEGVLTPTLKSVIWDAPESINESVTTAQALEFISRVPLAQYTSLEVQTKFCSVLKRYFVPPGEIILYPGDFRRELYIIVKGFCQVFSPDKKLLGTLQKGNYFGLAGLIHGVNTQVEIVTETHCTFFCLLYEDYLELTENFKILDLDFKVLKGEAHIRHSQFSTVTTDQSDLTQIDKPDTQIDDIVNTSTGILDTQSIHEENITSPSEEDVQNPDPILSTYESNHEVTIQVETIVVKKQFRCLSSTMSILTTTIKPTGVFIKYWTILRSCSAILVTIFSFIQASFALHPTWSFFVMLIFDLIAWIDMYIMLHLAYFDQNNQIVNQFFKSVENYITGPFFLDLLGCFPLEVFIFILSPNKLGDMFSSDNKYGGNHELFLIAYLRLNRMLQIYRLFTASYFLNKSIVRSLTFVTLIETIPMMFVFINILTCFSFNVFCYWENGDPPTVTVCSPESWIGTFRPLNPKVTEVAWLTKPNYNLTPSSYYIIALYWVTQTAFRVGFGDFKLVGDNNKILAVIVILLGLFVSTYIGGKLMASSVGKDLRRITFRAEMRVLITFMSQFGVSQAVKTRIKEMYFNNWERSEGISSIDFFVSLHPNLKAEVATELYETSLLKCPLLANLDKHGIRMLASKLHELYFPGGEYIMRFGDLNSDFFLITKGIIVCYKEDGEVINYLGPGSLIGEISAILEVRRVFSAVAATNVDVFVFNRNNFLDFLDLYPELAIKLEISCIQHYKDSVSRPQSHDILKSKLSIANREEVEINLQDPVLPTDLGKGETKKRVTLQERPVQVIHTYKSDNYYFPNTRGSSEDVDDDNYEITSSIFGGSHEHDETTDEHLVGSYVSLTAEEATKHPEFIRDPIRVIMKPGKDKHGTKDENDVGLQDKKQPWYSSLLTFGRIPKHDMGLIHIHQEKQNYKFYKIVIHPASSLCSSSIFACLYLLITCISCSLAAFEISFKLDNHTWSERTIIIFIRSLIELFFIIRFIGNFHLGYYDENGLLITQRIPIFKRYAKRYDGLVLDILTTFPFNFYEFISLIESESIVDSFSTILLALKLLRVLLIIRYLRETQSNFQIKVSQIKIIKISIVLSFIFHFCACVWYWIACHGFDCVPGSWMSRTIERFINEESKIVKTPEEVSVTLRYFLSLFYITNVITFTGLDDVEPSTLQEICWTIFLIFATIFVVGYLVGEMSQCLSAQIAGKIHYQHELAVLEEHFLSLGLTKSKMKDVRKFYNTLWQKSKGRSIYDILQQLPYPLRADISFEVYGSNVKTCRVLSKVDDVITREICARIKHEIYLPGAHIIHSGEMCDAMYFIKKGEIVMLDENENLQICVEVLYENESFGEIKLLLSHEHYRFSYIARLESEVGVLLREDFDEIFRNYPLLRFDLLLRATKIKKHHTKEKDVENGILEPGLDDSENHEDDGYDDIMHQKTIKDTVARLSIHGGPFAERLRMFSTNIRKTIDIKAFEIAKRSSVGSSTSQLH